VHVRVADEVAVPAATAARLVSLDAFRGITMAGMTIVNNPGTWSAMYWPLEHAEWNGWTPTDLIFPFFLFIVGVSMTLSRQTLDAPAWRIARRAAVIVGCGAFLAGFPFFNPHRWRIPGVLQRIGVCYLMAAVIYRATPPRRRVMTLAVTTAVLLVGYWFALTRFGDLTAEGNVGASIDRALMGGHLWRTNWDPEGLLSTIPAIATTIVGILAGLWLKATEGQPRRRVGGLAIAGAALFIAGEIWGLSFPINKSLWTSSYVLLTGGAAALLLAVCIYAIDIRGFKRGSHPFVVLGGNALTLFVLSGLLAKSLILVKVPYGDRTVSLQWVIYERGFAWMASPKNSSLIFSLAFLAVMYLVCDVLYRRRLFIRA
jgi:predicted acyltransferase